MTKMSLPLVNAVAEPPRFWRSVEELNDRSVREVVEREFPEQAGFLSDDVSRRKFLTLMGASLALAGVGGCGRQAPDKIVPRIKQPEDTIPGKPKFYATAMPMPGGATGLVVESHEGRPTKIEGNPDHPASLGASGIFEQASILGLYDPDRAKTIKRRGQIIGWDDALLELRRELRPLFEKKGEGIAFLTGAINSPTLASQCRELFGLLPKAKWYSDEPTLRQESDDPRPDCVYDLGKAKVVVSVDCDFLASGPNHLRYARDFSQHRDPAGNMNRLYAIESTPSPTGFAADHRFALSTKDIAKLVVQLAVRLGVTNRFQREANQLADTIAADILNNEGRTVFVAGRHLPRPLQQLIGFVNQKVGFGLVRYLPIGFVDGGLGKQLSDLSKAIDQNEIQALILLSVNPAYNAPAELDFGKRIGKVSNTICLSHYEDETAILCQWHIPQCHFLESWGDSVGPDGSVSIVQPLIAPLYQGKTALEFLGALQAMASNPDAVQPTRDLEKLRTHWRQWHVDTKQSEVFDVVWRDVVRQGIVPNTTPENVGPTFGTNWEFELDKQIASSTSGFELLLRPDPTVFDGRFANNAWLQELPKPITKLVWENAAIMSPATAKEIGVSMHEGPHGGSHGELITELVELTYRGRTVTAPVYILPGHADKCVTLHFGYGRTKAGRVGTGLGVNAYALQTSDAPWGGPGLEIKRTGKSYTLGCTQSQHSMHGRDLVRLATVAEFAKDPSLKPKGGHHHAPAGHNPHVEGFEQPPPEFYTNPQTKPPYQWGMSVDLGKCNGCQACVIACQAENNLPVVGKDMVTRGREMHWMRIDRYFTGDENNPQAVHQPVMCQHCENAPCEVVCPVEATTHSPDGLNEMTYNRCVGTRYCANNCPYKVRRFNFLEYTDYATESLKLQRNPDVSVRVRGVMEKCTYCVQRIREAEITAKVQHRSIRDGDVITACQQACPTEAIIFGNILDEKARVYEKKHLPRDYGILTELNTKPRTTYLPAIRNPNPEIG